MTPPGALLLPFLGSHHELQGKIEHVLGQLNVLSMDILSSQTIVNTLTNHN